MNTQKRSVQSKLLHLFRNTTWVLLLPALGCMHGGKIVKQDLATKSQDNYRLESCKVVATGVKMETPEATYHLIKEEGQVSLFERGPDGTGTLIQNRWTGSDGDHYFGWVTGMGIAAGWEFVIPEDKSQSGKRLAFESVRYDKKSDGSIRPVSTPDYECRLTRLP